MSRSRFMSLNVEERKIVFIVQSFSFIRTVLCVGLASGFVRHRSACAYVIEP